MIRVRLAHISDAPELKKLNDLYNGEDSASIEEIKRTLEENTQEIVCVASEINGNESELVGFSCGQIIKSMCYTILYGDITEFFILEKHQHQDIGKQLIKQMEIEFDKQGVNHLHHFTGADNLAVKELYRSLGYADTSASSYGSSSLAIFEKDTDISTD
jgi:ribosomal protein S18 acetylase RimI-like enzyme